MAERAPNLVTVGDNCLDVYLTKAVLTVGGCALNVAAHWRRAGLPARYFGAVGDDAEAAILLDAIAKAGLALDDVERRAGPTAVTLLREQDGDRIFVLEELGVGKDYLPREPDYPKIAKADWVHLGLNANPVLVRRLATDRVPFSLDLSTAHDSLPLEGVPLVFASGPEAPDAPVEPIAARLNRAGARDVVITCGSRGAFFRGADGRLLHAPATPVAVLDTCGAGDCFIAAFIAAFVGNRPAAAALREAAAAAAQTCLHLGGFPQQARRIPDWLLDKYAAVIAR
ncbi:PfkB family carbohydrate kinase [Dongia sp.]|uniref:PfkB family carbohydrate kinase n=1 Tax=Dongia sp. TaxID=1977262 RepID=UPI0037513899